jgi:hypothetical protein
MGALGRMLRGFLMPTAKQIETEHLADDVRQYVICNSQANLINTKLSLKI